MESAPDEILLHIFSFLPTEVLVGQVRGVCHRWRSLALEPSLWRWRSVTYDGDYPDGVAWRALARVLTLAPCLLTLDIAYLAYCPELQRLARTTTCAAYRLICWDGHEEILRNQLRLRRLGDVTITVYSFSSLVKTLDVMGSCDSYTLDNVCVNFDSWLLDEVPLEPATMVSVKRLDLCDLMPAAAVYMLLARCAGPQLESLRLHFPLCWEPGELEWSAALWLPLLAGCPALQHASVPLVPQLGQLARCPELTSLELLLTESTAELTGSALQFLRDAARIRRLELTWAGHEESSRSFSGVNSLLTLQTLVSQMAPTLEHLSLSDVPHGVSLLELLRGILARQPALRSLELPLPPEGLPAFLSRLPAVAPDLCMLILDAGLVSRAELWSCMRGLGLPEQLHVMAWLGDETWVGVYSHDPAQRCQWHKWTVCWHYLHHPF